MLTDHAHWQRYVVAALVTGPALSMSAQTKLWETQLHIEEPPFTFQMDSINLQKEPGHVVTRCEAGLTIVKTCLAIC